MASQFTESTVLEEKDTVELPEIDGELLMELLDASPAGEEADEDRLGLPVGSLDAELGWDQDLISSIHTHQGCEDCGLDDINLSDLESYDCSESPVFGVDGAVGWTGTAVAADAMAGGDGLQEWYMDGILEGEEVLGFGDGRGYCCFPCGGEACEEEVFGSPLWL